jgi:hypothetical protein
MTGNNYKLELGYNRSMDAVKYFKLSQDSFILILFIFEAVIMLAKLSHYNLAFPVI